MELTAKSQFVMITFVRMEEAVSLPSMEQLTATVTKVMVASTVKLMNAPAMILMMLDLGSPGSWYANMDSVRMESVNVMTLTLEKLVNTLVSDMVK